VNHFGRIVAIWTICLGAGYALVLGLGQPLPTDAEQLNAAYHPAPLVSREAALASAETIRRLGYPEFQGLAAVVQRVGDQGVDRWLITFSESDGLIARGLSISIGVDTGITEVATYP
jgi:hypothetical protein